MTEREKKKCKELVKEAKSHLAVSKICFEEAESSKSLTRIEIKELQGQSNLGYAQGIIQALVLIGFKDPELESLCKEL